jgi:hypothetical protein
MTDSFTRPIAIAAGDIVETGFSGVGTVSMLFDKVLPGARGRSWPQSIRFDRAFDIALPSAGLPILDIASHIIPLCREMNELPMSYAILRTVISPTV